MWHFQDCDYAANETDPDIMGFGVIVAFLLPIFASHAIIIFMFLTRAIHPHQYAHLDRKFVAWVERRGPTLTFLRATKFEQLLLGLGDQLLVYSGAALIAIYTQINTASLFSFQIVVGLAFVSSSVHLGCLFALSPYFHQHTVQAWLRLWLIRILTALILVSDLLNYMTWYNDPRGVASCAVQNPQADMPLSVCAWLAVCYAVIGSLRDASAQLSADSELRPTYSSLLSVVRFFCRSPESRRALEALEQQEIIRARKTHVESCERLHQSRNLLSTWRIAFPVVIDDLAESLVWTILTNIAFAAFLLTCLVLDFTSGIDVEPLRKITFGQIIALLLVAVFVLSVCSATGVPQTATVKTEDGRLDRWSRVSTSGAARPNLADVARQLRPSILRVPERAEAGTSGRVKTMGDVRHPRLSVPKAPKRATSAPPIRVNTVQMEAGDSTFIDLDNDKGRTARETLMKAVYAKAPRFSGFVIFTAFMSLVGFIVASMFYHREVTVALFAVTILKRMVQVCLNLRAFRQARARQRIESKRDEIEMEEMEETEAELESDQPETNEQAGEPPTERKELESEQDETRGWIDTLIAGIRKG